MNPCPHYLGTVAGGRAVINCLENRIRVFINSAYHYLKQCGRDIFNFGGQRTDKGIVGFVTTINACCSKPACNGFRPFVKSMAVNRMLNRQAER